ncbi:hypothetical protein JNUCC0626_06950 [Lentzea sp. JNUCC 0626]|uniref:hypothetical protein n=1 Tax=Lentzea sp. JNUCC 0626 TaxID=3367513 RepID=UPI003749C33C
MSKPTNQQWLDHAAQQAREHIASLHQEGLESLLRTRTPVPSGTTAPTGTTSDQDTADAPRFGGVL